MVTAGLQKIEVYMLGGMVAIALAFSAAYSTGPGGFTMTAEDAAIEAHQGARLVVVESSGCGWCVRLRRDIAPGYQQSTYHTEVAPLTYATIGGLTVRSLKLSEPVFSTPTLLVVDRKGNELGRMTGYPGSLARMQHFVGTYTSN